VIHFIDGVLLPPELNVGANLTLVDAVARDASFNTLEAALVAANLTEALSAEGPFTLLAPTNDAFTNFYAQTGLTEEEVFANTELLTTILTYHVLEGQLSGADIAAAYAGQTERSLEVATLQGELLGIQVDTAGTILVGGAGGSVFLTDIPATNGTIHAINTVMVPPSLRDEAGNPLLVRDNTIADRIIAAPELSTLEQAIEAAGLTDTLENGGPYTIFVPTNDGFNRGLGQINLTAGQLLADPETLTAILNFLGRKLNSGCSVDHWRSSSA
jgi:uncharacterized surface protein with fasciclin (FAS1) repeats